MTDVAATAAPDLTTLTVQLLSAYVANNKLEHGELAGLIQSTKAALGAPDSAPAEAEAAPEPQPAYKRATSINKSLADPHRIVSMIDGKPYRTLTRHLKKHGLTPAEYRARYKLPNDYPLIAPGYSEERRQAAHNLGLGGRKRATADAPAKGDGPPATALETQPAPEAKAAPTPAPGADGSAATGRRRKATRAATASEAPASEAPPRAAPAARKRRTQARAVASPEEGEAVPEAKPRARRGRRGGGDAQG